MKSFALNFHGIGVPGPQVDTSEAPYWITEKLFSDIISYISVWRHKFDIHITFDDGNLSDLELAAPILKSHGVQARFFVLAGRLGSERYLSKRNLEDLRDLGFGVGLHGYSHVDWTKQTDKALFVELDEGRCILEDAIGDRIDEVGIPFGSYDRRILCELGKRGFSAVWSSDGGSFDPKAVLRPRTSVTRNMTVESIGRSVLSGGSLVSRTRRSASMALKQHL